VIGRAWGITAVFTAGLGTQSLYAQPSLDEQRAAARQAAEEGRCDETISIGGRIAELDRPYHASVFMADPVIAACFAMADAGSSPPPPAASSAVTPTAPPETTLAPPSMADTCRQRRSAELRAAQTIHDPNARAKALLAVAPCTSGPVAAKVAVRDEDVVVRTGTPPLSGGRLVGQIAVGGALGIVVGGIGGGMLGYALDPKQGCRDFCGLGGFVLGGTIGMVLLTPAGVYLAGSTGGQTGSYGAALAGAALGAATGIALSIAAESPAPFLIGPTIGAVIGFNSTRRWAQPSRPRVSWTPTMATTTERSIIGIAGQF
jgi:hypothetical protein